MRTLVIDIGGTYVKMGVVDEHGELLQSLQKERTPPKPKPSELVEVLVRMRARMPKSDRTAVGFPGVVKSGVTKNAPNLGDENWLDVPLQDLLRESNNPIIVLNDADLQGFGVVVGSGVELVLTLGTGLGAALFTDGKLVPNIELGHHYFLDSKTYEDVLGAAYLRTNGPASWNRQLERAIPHLNGVFNPDRIHLGGGNIHKITKALPSYVSTFSLEDAMRAGMRVWKAN